MDRVTVGTLELIDPGEMCELAMSTGFLNIICSVACSTNIGWNYSVDYTWARWQFERWWRQCDVVGRRAAVILDIGCGPGVLHYYLEYTYGVNIIGVDRQKWDGAATEIEVIGDFIDPETQQAALQDKKADLILSISSFEHNDYDGHKASVDACLDNLAPGGWLISTVSANCVSTRTDEQWNLSPEELGIIYRAEPPTNYEWVHGRWRGHRALMRLYRKRYGEERWSDDSPHFVVAGAVVRKEA